jgi:cytochrome c2
MTRFPPHAAVMRCLVVLLAPLAIGCSGEKPVAPATGGQPHLGKVAIERYGCAACHTIPGIPGHGANVGPPLTQMAARAYVAGVLPNTPDNLVRWLQDPPEVDPLTAMPNLGVSQAEAADMAAYLYSLD